MRHALIKRADGTLDALNLALFRLIDAKYTQHPFDGCATDGRLLEGTRGAHPDNRKRVWRFMRVLGLVGIAPKPAAPRVLQHRPEVAIHQRSQHVCCQHIRQA